MNADTKYKRLFSIYGVRQLNKINRALARRSGIMLLEEIETFPVIADINEDVSVIEVSVLKQYDSDVNSYTEIRVEKHHPMYERFYTAISMLNIAGDEEKHPTLGQRVAESTYVIELNEQEHKQLLSS